MNVVDAVLQQVGGQARLLLFYLESETVNKTDAPRYRCMPNLIKTKFNMKATECIRPYTGRDEKGCAHSAVAYTATLYHMMVKIMKPSPAWANFSIMMECIQKSAVATLCILLR